MGKEKLANALQAQQHAGRNIFVPYIMAGDGGLDRLVDTINFLEECGATAIEIGIPFSDPVADGPTIQAAGQRALAHGTTLAKVLKTLKQNQETRSIPIILMTYINPIFVYGIERFAQDCVKAGVDGVIVPDVPLEEEELIAPILRDYSIALIRLITLETGPHRRADIIKKSEGFIYTVSVTGTTGMRESHDTTVYTLLQELKQQSSIPVLAGFGISTAKQAQEMSQHCDGVIVGSKIVQLLHEGKNQEIKELILASL